MDEFYKDRGYVSRSFAGIVTSSFSNFGESVTLYQIKFSGFLVAQTTTSGTESPRKGIIHHSVRGVQYAAHDYVDILLEHGFRISMARKGNSYDNATAESFMKALKMEEVYLWEYKTLADVQQRLPYFIEQVYNRLRLHSALGYQPPVEFAELFFETHKLCPTAPTQAFHPEGCTPKFRHCREDAPRTIKNSLC